MIQRPKGTRDILPSEIEKWQYVEGIFKNIVENYSYVIYSCPVYDKNAIQLNINLSNQASFYIGNNNAQRGDSSFQNSISYEQNGISFNQLKVTLNDGKFSIVNA